MLNQENTPITNDTANEGAATSSFARLYEEYMTYIYRYINYRVGNRNAAEDLTSTVFEKALAAFHKYERKKAAPQTWLMAIARNTVTDYFRKSGRASIVPLENAFGIQTNDPSPQEAIEAKEKQAQLRLCFSALRPHEQEIISLKFGAEMNNRNIASMLSLSESNVGAIVFRTIGKLRKCFEDWLNGR